MKAIIFCNGDIEDYNFTKEYLINYDLAICCDGGLRHAHFLNILPDFILGDFDSVDHNILDYYKKKGVTIERFPKEKDSTDSEIGLLFAMEKGCDEIVIIGGMGTRFDHTLSNLYLLCKALENNVKAILVNEKNKIWVTKDSTEIFGKPGDLISILPLTIFVSGVTTEGLFYKLDGERINLGQSIGISNILTEDIGKISLEEGILAIIKSKD